MQVKTMRGETYSDFIIFEIQSTAAPAFSMDKAVLGLMDRGLGGFCPRCLRVHEATLPWPGWLDSGLGQ